MEQDHYEVLGISEDATADDIKHSFRELAKRFHPDSNPHDPRAQARFIQVSRAYDTLSDGPARAAYDESRAIRSSSRSGFVLETAHAVEGWYRDPYGRHVHRWFSAGEPTDLVRDDGVTSQDPPPDEPPVLPLEPAEEATARPFDLVRAGDGDDPFTDLESDRLNQRLAVSMTLRLVFSALCIALLGFLGWLNALDVVEVDGDTLSAVAPVGQSYYLDTGVRPVQQSGSVAPASVGVTVNAVSARADRKTTDGTVSRVPLVTVLCIRRPGTPPVNSGTAAQLAAACSSVRPLVTPEFVDLGPAVAQLLYEVPGTVSATYTQAQISMDYSQGIRRATATGLARYTLVVSEAAK
jgi:hypothetical protein